MDTSRRDLLKTTALGGMDFVMNWRHLDCIRQGITPDSVVYDAAKSYQLHAEIKADGGTDSYGEISVFKD